MPIIITSDNSRYSEVEYVGYILKRTRRLCPKEWRTDYSDKKGQTLLDIPVFQVDNIAVIGNVQISTQALHMLMSHGVDVSYFTMSGQYLGITAAESTRNIFLRFEQYRCYMNESKRINLARCIVDGKIHNQMALIRDHRWASNDCDWKTDLDRMEQIRRTIRQRENSQELMGTEGICSQIYFGAFARMLKCDFRNDAYMFRGRNRRPPKDPVNVILSLAYTFLTREVCSILEAESFEPYLGFLHGIRYGRKSLALDLMEEFRQPVIDRLVLMQKRYIHRLIVFRALPCSTAASRL